VALKIIISISAGTRNPSRTAMPSSTGGVINEAAKLKTMSVNCQTRNKDIGIIIKASEDSTIFFMTFNIG
jgi:hypothetical protein